jgi:peptidoglycan/LPS O-acetylase OafA/YrhL
VLVFGYHFHGFWAHVGWAGVDLFFVLSGFLISGILFQEYKETGNISFVRFFCRRSLKIWPPLYVLLATMAIIFAFTESPFPWKAFLANSLFFQNYVQWPMLDAGLLGHLWSLAIEEHFYIALPLLLIVLIKVRPGPNPFAAVPTIFAFVAVACLSMRILTLQFSVPSYLTQTHLRIDSLFAGVCVSYFHNFEREKFERLASSRNLILAAACFLPAVLLQRGSWMMLTVGLTALYVCFAILVAWSIGKQASGGVAALAAKIGFYSYSIYLWHVVSGLQFSFVKNYALALCLGLATAIGVGILMSKIIERPVLALRNRLFPAEVARSFQPQPAALPAIGGNISPSL